MNIYNYVYPKTVISFRKKHSWKSQHFQIRAFNREKRRKKKQTNKRTSKQTQQNKAEKKRKTKQTKATQSNKKTQSDCNKSPGTVSVKGGVKYWLYKSNIIARGDFIMNSILIGYSLKLLLTAAIELIVLCCVIFVLVYDVNVFGKWLELWFCTFCVLFNHSLTYNCFLFCYVGMIHCTLKRQAEKLGLKKTKQNKRKQWKSPDDCIAHQRNNTSWKYIKDNRPKGAICSFLILSANSINRIVLSNMLCILCQID